MASQPLAQARLVKSTVTLIPSQTRNACRLQFKGMEFVLKELRTGTLSTVVRVLRLREFVTRPPALVVPFKEQTLAAAPAPFSTLDAARLNSATAEHVSPAPTPFAPRPLALVGPTLEEPIAAVMLAPFPMLDVVQASCAIMEFVKLIHVPH
jgi:hypothetical protein